MAMTIDYTEVGKRMAKRRKELGLKQYEVCEMINVNYKYISNLETGRSAPSLEMIMNLCEALETTPDYLLLGASTTKSKLPDKQIADKISCLDHKSKHLLVGILELLEQYSE